MSDPIRNDDHGRETPPLRRLPGWGVDREFMRGWRRLTSLAIGDAITSERSGEPSDPPKAVPRSVGARSSGKAFYAH